MGIYHCLYSNVPGLAKLEAKCSGGHSHASGPKGREYPDRFRKVIAEKVSTAVAEIGGALTKGQASEEVPEVVQISYARAAAGRQPRGAKYLALIPEFKEVLRFELSATMVKDLDLQMNCPLSRVARTALRLPPEAKVKEIAEGKGGVFAISIGVPLSIPQFVQEALSLRHPFDGLGGLSPDILRAIFMSLTLGPTGLRTWRDNRFSHYMKRAAALSRDEAKLKASLPEQNQKVLANNWLLLFREMCLDADVHDDLLLEHLSRGLLLVGPGADSAEFPAQDKPQALSVSQARLASKRVLEATCARDPEPSDLDLARRVWEKTQEEIQQGWMDGPFEEAEPAKRFGDYMANKSFGIKQGEDIRVIDDFSESLANHIFSSPFKAQFDSLDEVAVMAKAYLEGFKPDGSIQFDLPNGETLRGALNPSLTREQARRFTVRILDLKSAYKQQPSSRDTDWSAVIRVWNADVGRFQFFVPRVLPFGATAAVYGFARTSNAIRKIGTRLFAFTWTHFFDDYTQVDIEAYGDHAKTTTEKMLSLLGWSFATKEAKRRPFARKADTLGAVLDLSQSEAGIIRVANKPSRVEDLQAVRDASPLGTGFPQAQAASLRGRIVYAESQVFSRAASAMMPRLKARALPSAHGQPVDQEFIDELDFIIRFLRESVPRAIVANDWRKHHLAGGAPGLSGAQSVGLRHGPPSSPFLYRQRRGNTQSYKDYHWLLQRHARAAESGASPGGVTKLHLVRPSAQCQQYRGRAISLRLEGAGAGGSEV